ncbi:UNVERIFIED_CONTAM: hypothetical protein GTU68_053215, partial [Idotea baltica]|nr:hypothetical protein [Idotea baltica]
MSCSLTYRGFNPPADIIHSLQLIKNKKNIRFVDWCPTGFKVGLCATPPTTINGSLIAPSIRNVTMLTNSCSISQPMQRMCHKFHILYSKRAFVHWYV